MAKTDFVGLYLCAFVFGVLLSVFYDLIWVFRVSFLRNRFVWLTDILATLTAGILISVMQYNFSSGKFRILPFGIFALGVLFVRFTFSKILRYFIDKLIKCIKRIYFNIKMKFKSYICGKYILRKASKGFGLLKR